MNAITETKKSPEKSAEGSMKTSQPMSWLASVLVVLLSLSFSVFLAEIAARAYLLGPIAILPQYGCSIFPIGSSNVIQTSSIPGIPYVLKPNLNTFHKFAPFKTNSDGLRDREYTLTKPEGVYRVAVVGDSFSFPEGVPLERAWHSILETEFNKSSKEKKYEFINFAVGGYRFDEYVATLEHRALKYAPDHAIVGICPFNDLPMNWHRKRPVPYVVKEAPLEYYQAYLPKLLRQALPSLFPPAEDAGTYASIKKEWKIENCELESIRKSFKRLKDLGTKNGFGTTLVVLRRATETEFQTKTFEGLAKEFGFPIIDCGPSFPDLGKQWSIYPSDGHPNARANEVFARTISNSIQLD